MKTEKLDEARWKSYFDDLSTQLRGKQAFIEVASVDLGDQVEAEWMPLLGISYEPEGRLVDIMLQGMDHRVHNPKDISVVWNHGALEAIEIVDAENRQQIVRLRDPVGLTPT